MDPGGAAFYGPKISVQARDAIGRTWQMSTIQVDFNLPERFGLEYTAADGSRQRPVMIHRALFGSIERFFAVLLEHYAGAFPAWLAPVQVVGIPITDGHVDYLAGRRGAAARARGSGSRSTPRDDRMQKKIRNAQKQKVPFMLIAGDEDVAAGAVSFRYRDGTQKNGVPIAEAVAEVVDAVAAPGPGLMPATLPVGSDGWDRLWTPHRMAYIRGENKPTHTDAGRRVRVLPRARRCEGEESLVVARGEHVYAVLNLYPYNAGHLMVCPYRHVADYTDLDRRRGAPSWRRSPSGR